MDVDGSWVFAQNIVGDVTYPELVSYCIVLFCQGMIRSISIPAGFWTFVDFEESDCFEHLELHKSGRPSLPRITICYNICTLGLSRRMPEDTHLGDHTLGRRSGALICVPGGLSSSYRTSFRFRRQMLQNPLNCGCLSRWQYVRGPDWPQCR